jgi:hypothetical protein
MFEQILQAVAILVPLGVSPLLSIALFGVAHALGVYTPPTGLEPFMHPAIWVSALVFGGFIKIGRSAKLSKPLAEAIGSFESVFALFVSVAVMLPTLMRPEGGVESAWLGVPGIMSAIVLGLVATATIVTLRTAIDILGWLSPIPFVDFFLQLGKLALVSTLVALAVISPAAAVIVDALILVAAMYSVRWSIRNARFGLSVLHDLTLGRLGEKAKLPKDAIMPEDVGPFDVFVLEVEGMPKRSKAKLERKVGRWFVQRARWFQEAKQEALGDHEKAVFKRGWLGTTLELPRGKVLLPPKYKHLVAELEDKSAIAIDGVREPTNATRTRVPEASAIGIRAQQARGSGVIR